MHHKLLNVAELAERLRVPVSWVYGQTRQTDPNSIPRLKVGKYLRFDLEAVMTWLQSQQDNRTQR